MAPHLFLLMTYNKGVPLSSARRSLRLLIYRHFHQFRKTWQKVRTRVLRIPNDNFSELATNE